MQLFLTNGLGIAVDAIREVKKVEKITVSADNKKDVSGVIKPSTSVKGTIK